MHSWDHALIGTSKCFLQATGMIPILSASRSTVLISGETGTGKDVVLIGSRNHLEVFNASEWHAYRENLRKRSKEVSLRAKQKKVQDQGV